MSAGLLAIDVGNTHTVVGVYENDKLVRHWRVLSDPGRTSDEYGVLLWNLYRASELPIPRQSDIIVCSVVPPMTKVIEDLCRDYFHTEPLVVGPGVKTGMPILYDNPKEVGADRIVNAVAAYERYRHTCIVVDFGTATTFDCVAADGAYVGGAIAPGLELGLEALATRTAKLPRIELRAPARAIGRDTVSAMQSGTVFGYQALAAGLLTRIRAELAEANDVAPAEVKAILTGGLSAAPWAEALEGIDAIDPALTLKGLAILHAEVVGGERLELGLS